MLRNTERPLDGYLNVDAIVQACQKSGASGIHPGYGFLSENAGNARKLRTLSQMLPALPRACGGSVSFLGPPAELLELFGNKVGRV